MKQNVKHNSSTLREKAAELLKSRPFSSVLPRSESELHALVHELELQKLELEIQNEQLIQSQLAEKITNARYIGLFNSAPIGYIVLSAFHEILEINTTGKTLLGNETSSLLKADFTKFISESSQAVFKTFFREIFNNKSPLSCEVILVSARHEPFTVLLSGTNNQNDNQCLITITEKTGYRKLEKESPIGKEHYTSLFQSNHSGAFLINPETGEIKDSEGNLVSIIGSLLDVTKQKITEKELRSKTAILSNLLINLQEGILLENAQRQIALTNQLFCDMFAIPAPPEALTGADCSESADQTKHLFSDPEKFVSDINTILLHRKAVFNDELELTDGRCFERDYIPTFQDQEYTGHLWKYRDITERKQALRKVEESEARFSQVVEQSQEVVWEVDASGLYTYLSPLAAQVYGFAPDQLVGKKHFYDLAPDKNKQELITAVFKLFEQKTSFKNLLNDICRPDGRIITVITNGIPILNAKGDLIGYRGIDSDITERSEAEKRIISSEEKFRSITEQTSDLIAIADEYGIITFSSPASSSIFNLTPSEMCGRNFTEFIDETEIERATLVFQTCLEKDGNVKALEFKMKRADGSIFIGELNASNFISEAQKGILVTIRDITERKKAEQEIHELNSTLELKITEKTAELAASNQNLKNEIAERVKASEALEEALERLNKIADRIPGFVYQFQLNPDGTSSFPFASKGIQDICRLAPEAVATDASRVFSLIHPDDLDRVVASIQESAQKLSLWHCEYRVKFDDGIINWLQGNALPERLSDGTVVWHGFISDITITKQAEEEIKQITSRLALATRSSGVGVWDYDIVKNTLLWDDQMHVLFGVSKEVFNVTYEAWQAGLHPDDKDRCNTETQMAIRGEKEFNTEYRIKWPDGSVHYIRAFAIVNRDEKGNPLHMIGTNWDITAQKQAKEALAVEKQRLASIIEGTNVGTWEWNIQTGETIFNQRWAEILGYSLNEISPVSIKTWMKYAHPDDLKVSGELLEKHFKREIDYYSFESRMKHKNGSWVWVLDRGKVHAWDNFGKPLLMSGTHQEITEQKRVEEEIIKARIEAEQANLAKSEFLSRMSHELRTPMNSILGFAQLMEMSDLIPSHRKGINHILNSGKHLLDLINEVLDISKIESGRISLSMEPVSLKNTILEMIDIVQPLSEDKKLTIELLDSPTNYLSVIADNQRFKQVLLNLINNAVKYNRVGGTIQIKTELRAPKSKTKPTIRISVTDSGTGIRSGEINKLFLPFERIGAELTETEGTGLGLTVVKKLINAMNGTVGVESTLGKGSTFWIELKQSKQTNMKGKESASNVESTETTILGTVLYIEDNASNIELVEQIIAARRPDIRLISNPTGGNALKLALEYVPDIILLDLNLPDMHGSRVLENLKENEKTKSIPVVVISADAMPHQVEKLIAIGATKYLTKPLHVLDYLKVIDEYIGK